MAYNERTDIILKYLHENQKATVEELAAKLFVSDATIRRDLTDLQKSGQIKRTHGGAVFVEEADEISIFVRQEKNAKDKERVATIALRHLPDVQTIFIDNSSTCLALAERMNLTHKTVVTNGLQIAMRIARHDKVNIIIPGGEIKFNTSAVLGSMTANILNNFHFDLAIASCSAINAEGAYEFSLESMQIKQTVFSKSEKKILIVDKNKIGTAAAFRTAKLERFDKIITNASDDEINLINPNDKFKNFINR